MWRCLILCLGIIAATWLELEVFPGHTYLQGDSQIYLSVLEHLDTPGYLSRDLVATHPHVTYTVYDELTLLVHGAAGIKFETALLGQQALCRAAAILGVFLLVLSTGLTRIFAFAIAVSFNLGATLTGPAARLVEYEPVPRAFAFGLVVLALGLLAREKPLLAGLAGGLALLYHPATAAPLWALILAAFAFDRRLRPLLRPALTILLIFVLLLANLAQLQPGVADPQPFLGKLSGQLAGLQKYRTPYVWVSLWAATDIWNYLAIWICCVWATTRVWETLNRQMRWILLVLPIYGILSVPLSYLLLERMRWSLISEIEPAQALLFTVGIGAAVCGLAGMHAASKHKYWEAWLWFFVIFAIPVNAGVFDFLRLTRQSNLTQLAFCAALACGLAFSVGVFGSTRGKLVVLFVPAAAIFSLPAIGRVENYPKLDKKTIHELAGWAEKNTWGSSMFLFPDAGRELYPGIFRAESRRALWVDWESGELVDYFESAGSDWGTRWQETMEAPYTAARVQTDLSLPIDYYVLRRKNTLPGIRAVFENSDFVAYDATDLRESSSLARQPVAPNRH